VKASSAAAGRKKRPSISSTEPRDSEAAAMNPQKAGRNRIPRLAISPPILSQRSTPPKIFPQPWKISTFSPIPSRISSRPRSEHFASISPHLANAPLLPNAMVPPRVVFRKPASPVARTGPPIAPATYRTGGHGFLRICG